MAIRSRKPTSAGRRFQTTSDFSEITKSTPEKSLLTSKPKSGGRNVYGRKTARHRGGGRHVGAGRHPHDPSGGLRLLERSRVHERRGPGEGGVFDHDSAGVRRGRQG